ncbi:TPA: hypothetical protein ACUJ9P_004782 [Escherichia coli]
MTTFTDKELIKEIKERIGSLDVRDNIERRAYEIALASLEAEAVMFCISGQNVDSEEHVSTSKAVVDAWVEEWNQVDGSPGEPLYKTMPLYYHAALPAPVVPDEMYWQDAPVEGSSKAAAYATGWNACRAAMLHGAEPVSQTYKLNELAGNYPVTPDGWVMVPKEPTQAMIKAWLSEIANFRGHAAGYRAALEAAPQLEVNRG